MSNIITKFFLFLIFLQYFSIKLIECVNYCKLSCERPKAENTACRCVYGSRNCRVIGDKQAEFRQWIIDTHNFYRNSFAIGNESRAEGIKVANMAALSYDYDLEYTAYCHARLCQFQHDKCRRTEKFPSVGQNLYYIRKSSRPEKFDSLRAIERAIKDWYDEIDALKLAGEHSSIIDKFQVPRGPAVGHFTQVIWAKSSKVGCARAVLADGLATMLTCNYGPAGNFLGTPMFKRGEPCSNCGGLKCNQQYQGLCGDSVVPNGQLTEQRNISLLLLTLFCCMFAFI